MASGDSAETLHDPSSILEVEGDVTLEELNAAYREARTRVESKVASSDIAASHSLAQIEWAYRELLNKIETQTKAQGVEDDEDVVSAALLPGLTPEAASILGVKENVVYMGRKVQEEFEPVHPMDLPEFKNVQYSTQQHSQPAPLSRYTNMAPVSEPSRVVRPSPFQKVKSTVPTHASYQNQEESLSRLNNIIQASDQISGSLLKKLREEMNVSLDEINARTKIPRKYILSLEADDYANLPAVVYFRGFVASYLKYLGLVDRNDLVDSLTENYRARLRVISKSK